MPKLSKIRLWGKFFAIQTQLAFSDLEGYSVESSDYWRIEPAQFPSQLARSFSSPVSFSIFLEHQQNSLPGFTGQALFADSKQDNPIPLLNKATGTSLHIWELNFEGFSEYGAAKKAQKINNYTDLANDEELAALTKRLNFSTDLIVNALFQRPVIAHSLAEMQMAVLLFDKLDAKFLSIPPGTDTLIITGEMVWSGWLNLYMLLRKIRGLTKHDLNLIIDEQALWQSFLRGHKAQPELYKLDRAAFVPQVNYLRDHRLLKVHSGEVQLVLHKDEVDRKLILTKDRCGLFDLGSAGFATDNAQKLGKMLFLDVFEFPELGHLNQASFNHWWKTSLYPQLTNKRYLHLRQEELPIEVGNISVSFGDDFEVKSTAKVGSLIKQGEVIGSKQTNTLRVVDCGSQKQGIRKFMEVADGEIVKSGGIVAKIPSAAGLFEKDIVSPITGKVSYEAIADSLIVIRQELARVQVEAFHNGILIQVLHGQGYVIDSDYYAIPLAVSSPGKFRGVLVKPGYQPNSYPKILLVPDLEKFGLSLETILADRIVCILALSSGYEAYQTFIKRHRRQLKYSGLVITGGFGLDPSAETQSAIMKAVGRFINIDNHQLKLPLGSFSEKIKYYSTDAISSAAGLEQASAPRIGDKIRLISYSRPMPYARIEKVALASDQVLVNTSHTIEEGYLDNIILY